MELCQFAKDYLILGLRINKHIDGYVEHYYGPTKIQEKINSELAFSPKKLLLDCSNLIKDLPNQGFNAHRTRFLLKNLEAFQTILQVINGKDFQYLELVENLFDFKPILYEDNFFYSLADKANELYRGSGTLSERINRYVQQRRIPREKLTESFVSTLSIAQNRTEEFFPNLLPESTDVSVLEVKNKSWPMYCWYQGNFTSRIEINIDRIHYWTHLLYNICHEVYPGHHTERCIREKLLYQDKNFFECSILLIYTPEMVISEGMGVKAEDVLFTPFESTQILINELYPKMKFEDELKTLIRQTEIRKGFRRLESNLAYHKYVDKWKDEELIKFMKSLELVGDSIIPGILKFISDKIWAPYIQAYQGERLISEKYGERPQPNSYKKLLTEQTLPSDLK